MAGNSAARMGVTAGVRRGRGRPSTWSPPIAGDLIAEVAEDIVALVLEAEDAAEHQDDLRLRLAHHHIRVRLREAAEEHLYPYADPQ